MGGYSKKCPYCDSWFLSPGAVWNHVKAKHLAKCREYQQNTSNTESANFSQNFDDTKKAECSLKCPYCHRRFSSAHSVWRHVGQKHKDKFEQYKGLEACRIFKRRLDF